MSPLWRRRLATACLGVSVLLAWHCGGSTSAGGNGDASTESGSASGAGASSGAAASGSGSSSSGSSTEAGGGRTCVVCTIFCPYGSPTGPDGCPMCACNPPPVAGSCDAGGSTSLALNSTSAIYAYLNGKTMVMTGADIPTDPWGLNENVNNGGATPCLNIVTIHVLSSGTSLTWNGSTLLGTLNGAPTVGSTGTCDNATVSGSPDTRSTTVQITNVQCDASCFDIVSTFAQSGRPWQGRGSISTDGKTFSLEGYLADQAPTGDHCADGAVGAHGVTFSGTAFTGNAVQVYRIQ